MADDKGISAFVPDIIRFFLDEEPLPANVPTFRCSEPRVRRTVLGRLEHLVVKPTGGPADRGIGGPRDRGREPGVPGRAGGGTQADRRRTRSMGGPAGAVALDVSVDVTRRGGDRAHNAQGASAAWIPSSPASSEREPDSSSTP